MKRYTITLLILFLIITSFAAVVMAEENTNVLELDEIVVRALRHRERLLESSNSVEIITREDIEKRNVETAADILTYVPGVNINIGDGREGAEENATIRGSAPNQVLVLVDGQPLNDLRTGRFDLSLIPAELIEDIEIVKGPASAQYGANAVGGLISITTRSGEEDLELTNLRTNFASYNTQSYNLNHFGFSENLSYNLMAKNYRSDGFNEDQKKQSSLFTKFDYKLDDHSQIGASLRYTDTDRGDPRDRNYEDLNLNFNWDLNQEDREQSLKLSYHENTYTDDSGIRGRRVHDTDKIYLDFNRRNYYDDHNLSYGFNIARSSIDSDTYDQQSNIDGAVFVQDNWQLNDKTRIHLSGRYDIHDEFGSEFSPKVGINYLLNPNLSFFASAGEAFRAPDYRELYLPDAGMVNIVGGNPDLDPEKSRNYETGLRYIEGRTRAELNLFRKDIEDLIDLIFVEEGVKRYQNIGEATVQGGEVVLAYGITSDLNLDLSYMYLDAVDEESGEKLPLRPEHSLNLAFDYSGNNFNLRLDNKYVGEREDEYEDDDDNIVRVILDSYMVSDLTLSREVFRDTQFKISINNIFAEEYESSAGTETPGRNYGFEISRRF
ncbi:TonB-dependent receptor plug domain-containing protein [Halanaerobium hydrogeniformans]|uniref:TonB-dependent receptor n=1 Tax=Halanaerobium hydrogeniformans TaxID=656519 RepID=E4RK25_HALHG|nr:TonB-dependent receptor [Halanaerobium hydrogeniformans]ADQ15595.1 TonB-dependent receptor [Halanaerobium hydrogeniformans]